MPRLAVHQNPKLRRHAASGQAVVTLSGHDHYLGKWPPGQKDAPLDARAAYDRVVAEWRANGRLPVAASPAVRGLTVGELIVRYWPFVERHYRRPDGTPTGEADNIRLALRPLRQLYETLPASEFSPLKLKAIRQHMVEAGLARTLINARVAKIVRLFGWAVEEELVPADVAHGLREVKALQAGRCDARESPPVRPVADYAVEAVLPHLLPPVAAMVRLMRLTGMRSGEACRMRACDLDVTGAVWHYKPARHKSSHRGKARVIPLGPRAQGVVRPFLTTDLVAPLFSPARALAERAAILRARRRSPVQPSQRSRRKPSRRRAPGLWYTPHAVAVAVRRACDRADRDARQRREVEQSTATGREPVGVAKKVADADRLVPRWHVHQLRHSHASAVRSRYGLDAARTALGHAGASITELYAEKDSALAERVAAEVG
jgi:integrase